MIRQHRLRRGFTLTELLIVLGILVALMALVLPRLLSTRGKADEQTVRTQIGLFRGALERYVVDTRGFPSTEQGLIALFEAPGESSGGAAADMGTSDSETSDLGSGSTAGWDGPYMEGDGVPLDPWGNEFQYCYPPEKNKSDFPDIWSFGPDKEDGTEDDIGNWMTATSKKKGSESPSDGGGDFESVEGENFGVDTSSGTN